MLIMKYLNNIKLSLVAAVFVCTGTVFTGCEDDLTISGSTDKSDWWGMVYMWLCKVCRWQCINSSSIVTLFGDKREQAQFSLS